jgi:galactonate dehydratase
MSRSSVTITRLEPVQAGSLLFVRIHTSEGITGLGEMHPAGVTSGGRYTGNGFIQFIEEYLVGKDPTHIERHWQHMFRRSLFRGGADAMAAISGVDMALWDIAGKLVGLPVYKLLGGPVREKVKLFATPTTYDDWTPERLAENAIQLVDQGFTVLRIYPLGPREPFADMGFRQVARTSEKYVAALRKAVGDDIDIAIDVICLLSPAEAIETGRLLEPYGLIFFEDPIEPDNIEALGHVASKLPMPVSSGERLCTIHQFRALLKHNAAAFLRPDPGLAGGITNIRKIAAMAEACYVSLIPHNPLSWVNAAASLHLCAAVQNIAMLEHHQQGQVMDSPMDDLFIGIPELDNGYLIVSDRPGLGIELNDEALKHFPPSAGQRLGIVGADGGLRDY